MVLISRNLFLMCLIITYRRTLFIFMLIKTLLTQKGLWYETLYYVTKIFSEFLDDGINFYLLVL